MTTPERRSREAYARSHGLDAYEMELTVSGRRINASMHAYNKRFNLLLEPVHFENVLLGDDNWHLSPEEAEAVEKAFSVRNKPTIPVKPCPPRNPVTFTIKDTKRLESFEQFQRTYLDLSLGELYDS